VDRLISALAIRICPAGDGSLEDRFAGKGIDIGIKREAEFSSVSMF